MKIIALLLVFLLLTLTTAVSGCTQAGKITSPEQAQETLGEISQDVGDVGDTLAEIDQGLG